MTKCHESGCRNLEMRCKNCARVVCDYQLPKSEWISVKDQPPPKDKPFLGLVLIGFHCDGLKDDREKDIVTYIWDSFVRWQFIEYCHCSGCEREEEYIEVLSWMPLPEPPKE